jgi:hypothetical protein
VLFSVPVPELEVVESLVRSLEMLVVVVGGGGGGTAGACTTTCAGGAGTYVVVVSLLVLVVPQALTRITNARLIMLIAKR